jgi:hypothetical protein
MSDGMYIETYQSFILLHAALAVAAFSYFPLAKEIAKGEDQSFATWLLWSLLDLITCISVYRQNGEWNLIAGYVIGGLSISLLLFRQGKISWSWFEYFIVILLTLCLGLWYLKGDRAATVMGTTAVCIASLPQFLGDYKKPKRKTVIAWYGFGISNLLTFFGAEEWGIKYTFYPGACAGLCVILVILNSRKISPTTVLSPAPA